MTGPRTQIVHLHVLMTHITDLHLMDWGSRNILAVGLSNTVYLWDAATGTIMLLMRMEPDDYVSSVSWSKDGTFLAVGTSDCKVQV